MYLKGGMKGLDYLGRYLIMLDRLLWQQFLNFLLRLEEGERGLDDAVEQEGEVDQHRETDDLQPLERFPA